MTFDDWWDKQEDYLYDLEPEDIARHSWQAAQKSEKEKSMQLYHTLRIISQLSSDHMAVNLAKHVMAEYEELK
jgi:hypothetical protein